MRENATFRQRQQLTGKLKFPKSRVWQFLLGLLVSIETLSVLYWTCFPYLSILRLFAQIDDTFASVLAPFSPGLLLMLLYSWIGIILYSQNNRLSRRLKALVAPVVSSVKSLGLFIHSPSDSSSQLTDHPRKLFLIGIFSALFLAIIPYRPDLNPNGIPDGI